MCIPLTPPHQHTLSFLYYLLYYRIVYTPCFEPPITLPFCFQYLTVTNSAHPKQTPLHPTRSKQPALIRKELITFPGDSPMSTRNPPDLTREYPFSLFVCLLLILHDISAYNSKSRTDLRTCEIAFQKTINVSQAVLWKCHQGS